jgi:hypothetical protein
MKKKKVLAAAIAVLMMCSAQPVLADKEQDRADNRSFSVRRRLTFRHTEGEWDSMSSRPLHRSPMRLKWV